MISLVVPVYNEAANIGPFLRDVETQVREPNEILIVYDFPEDNTLPAIAALEPARRFELAITPMNPAYSVWYVRGLAYSKVKDGEKAAEEFQKILDNPGRGPMSLLRPLAHLQMARALAMKGDAAGAKKAYQDFLAMWKDEDPDLPALVEAKAEYGRMK